MRVASGEEVSLAKVMKAARIQAAVGFALGFGSGWAARSLSSSPGEVGTELAGAALRARQRLRRWAALERDRIEDRLAEARARVGGADGA
jgi:hypothetical protein